MSHEPMDTLEESEEVLEEKRRNQLIANVDQLTKENQILKQLWSDLHKYVTTLPELNDSVFEQSITLKPNPPESNLYRQAQDIYNKLKEIKEIESAILRTEDERDFFKECCNNQKILLQAIDSKWKSDLDTLHSTSKRLKEMEKAVEISQEKEANYDKEIFELIQQSINQTEYISKLKTEIDDYSNRLSKLAGDRLTHDNMNIADLSDGDRPTKLSEVYSELYDNEWTDAFEELISCAGFEGKDAITQLLKIILMSFHACRHITWQRYHKLKTVASTIDLVHAISSTGGTFNEHHTCTLTIDQEKEIKSIWRTTTSVLKNEAVKHLHKVLLRKFDVSIENLPKTSKYLASCIDLCWKMGVQEKPMHLYPFAEKVDDCDEIFDGQNFRAYTKAGKRVAYFVWPALFLHEGGATLVKGIAQGC